MSDRGRGPRATVQQLTDGRADLFVIDSPPNQERADRPMWVECIQRGQQHFLREVCAPNQSGVGPLDDRDRTCIWEPAISGLDERRIVTEVCRELLPGRFAAPHPDERVIANELSGKKVANLRVRRERSREKRDDCPVLNVALFRVPAPSCRHLKKEIAELCVPPPALNQRTRHQA